MQISHERILRICRERLRICLKTTPGVVLPLPKSELVKTLAGIVGRNIELGRHKSRAQHGLNRRCDSLSAYVDRVIAHWLAEYPRVRRLDQNDAEEWSRLFHSLSKSARRICGSREPSFSQASTAEDYAASACERIRASSFPFDVVFDAWAITILRHLIVAQYRSPDILDHPHGSIDLVDVLGGGESVRRPRDEVPDGKPADDLAGIESRALLEEMIDQLASQAQRQVIRLSFFEGWSDERIAARLEKRVANIQILRYRALKNLDKIAAKKGVKEFHREKHQNIRGKTPGRNRGGRE